MQFRNDKLMKAIFDLLRPLFVKDWDRNEDYICGHCGRPVLKRYLFCSRECSSIFDRSSTNSSRPEENVVLTEEELKY